MKTTALILAAGMLIAMGARSAGVVPRSANPPVGIGKWDMSITQSNLANTVCVPGYTKLVRTGKVKGIGSITDKIKTEVYRRDGKTPDGLPRAKSHCCEIDHAFPLELGGANVIENLWAESWDNPYGAHQKDVVETALHARVCSADPKKKMDLDIARGCIAGGWYECGKKIGVLK